MNLELKPIVAVLLKSKLGALLIVLQTAIAMAILTNAVAVIQERSASARRPSGVDEANVFTIKTWLFRQGEDLVEFEERNRRALQTLPGVEWVDAVNQMPLSQSGTYSGFSTSAEGGVSTRAACYITAGSAIKTWGLKLVEGRDFNPNEIVEVKGVEVPKLTQALVTLPLAKKLFPGETHYVGRSIFGAAGSDGEPVSIIGVVERLQMPSAEAGERGESSVVFGAHRTADSVRFSVRVEDGQLEKTMAEAQKRLNALSKNQIVLPPQSMGEFRKNRYAVELALAGLLILISIALVCVTASGIVGLASLWVTQRRKSIGIRRALGATRLDILRYFLTENAVLSLVGITLGIGLALSLNQLLMQMLSLPRLPLLNVGACSVGMLLLGLIAVYGPARRASMVSPTEATRSA